MSETDAKGTFARYLKGEITWEQCRKNWREQKKKTAESDLLRWAMETTGQTEDDLRRNTYKNKIQLFQMKRDEPRFAYYNYFAKDLIKDKAKFCVSVDAWIKEEKESAKMYNSLGLEFIGNDELEHAKLLKTIKKQVC